MQKRIPIPQFPEFRLLGMEDQNEIHKFTRGFPPSGDYNFVSLWCYNVKEDIVISNLHGNLIVRFRDYVTQEPFFSFFGFSRPLETIGLLMRQSLESSIKQSIGLIPEYCLSHFQEMLTNHQEFAIKEDRDNFDYVYSVKELSELQGASYQKKRYWTGKFNRLYPNFNVKIFDLKKSVNHDLILSVFMAWARSKKRFSDETEHDFFVVKRFLHFAHNFETICLGIYCDNKIVGFSITEPLENKYAVCHFVKGDVNFKGIFETIYQQTALELRRRGIHYLNRENDLGISGLRHAKESWKPISYVKKYSISLRENLKKNKK